MASNEEDQPLIDKSRQEAPEGSNNPYVSDGGKSSDYTVNLSEDVYDAIVVASFVGLTIHDYDDDGERSTRTIPPILFLIFVSVPVFFLQVTLIWCLFLDTDFQEEVVTKLVMKEAADRLEKERLFIVQILMVLTLANILLKEFLDSTHGLAIIVNPKTWQCIKKPTTAKAGLGRLMSGVNFFCCLASKAMQLYVIYNTFTISLSVILGEHSAIDAVFDSLATTFIIELHGKTFEVVCRVFHIDVEQYRDDCEKFTIKPEHVETFGEGPGQRLHRSHVVTLILSFVTLELMYVRQLLLVDQAHRTGTLPIARDMCLFYHGMLGKSFEGRARVEMTEWGTMYIDFKEQVQSMVLSHSVVPRVNSTSIVCDREEYQSLGFFTEVFLALRTILTDDPLHSKALWMIVFLTFALIVYQAGYVMYILYADRRHVMHRSSNKPKPTLGWAGSKRASRASVRVSHHEHQHKAHPHYKNIG
mmetsp:Transcript_70605/g.169163  ORF Transcript_70605/g.169163 Transcript_70605/m.169163 type:complete len:473 (-) Transcript_70605:247-1665(-)